MREATASASAAVYVDRSISMGSGLYLKAGYYYRRARAAFMGDLSYHPEDAKLWPKGWRNDCMIDVPPHLRKRLGGFVCCPALERDARIESLGRVRGVC